MSLRFRVRLYTADTSVLFAAKCLVRLMDLWRGGFEFSGLR